MTPEEARYQIENDPDIGGSILFAVSVLEEAAAKEATAAERDRCAKLVENFDAHDDDGEWVTPGLGYWCERGGEATYIPDAEAIAAKIREG